MISILSLLRRTKIVKQNERNKLSSAITERPTTKYLQRNRQWEVRTTKYFSTGYPVDGIID